MTAASSTSSQIHPRSTSAGAGESKFRALLAVFTALSAFVAAARAGDGDCPGNAPQQKSTGIATAKTVSSSARATAAPSESGKAKKRLFPLLQSGTTLATDRTLDTRVSWERSVNDAADKAEREGKLVFVIHVSGDFEQPEFTWNNAQAFRAGALSDERIGELLNTKFVAAHQQAGDFQVVVQDGKIVQKNGGNVASYFCTPDGRVINAALGPVGADELLREAKWAVDTYRTVESANANDRNARLASAHGEAAAGQRRNQQSRQIHQLLAEKPLAGLDEIYGRAFEALGEGNRAKGLESTEVVALQRENERINREAQRLRERVNGAGSAKALALQEENGRIRDETQQLREIDDKRRREETQASSWLRTATSYLESGKKEDEESARARLKVILDRYPSTKAAEKAAEMLASPRP